MPKKLTAVVYGDPGKVTLRTSIPKEFCTGAELTEYDSLEWSWDEGGKEARVRKV